ncbi:MAG TPA: DUF4178 domain-containing protein, partial [Chitinophagaceae bacterium]|nr:DUF4178 domain-containing protein [Chitinophagaceae bacterium]
MSVSLQACPSCGRALSFGHEHTNLKVCTCGSVLYRSDDGTVVEKAVLGVQQGFEVITPGAGGSWNGEPFTVLGRVRAWIEEFVWNYWTIAFESGRIGYLGEGYGLYALYEPAEPGPNAAIKTNGSRAGDEVELFPKQYFLLERKYTCYKWEAEGEAWLPFLPDTFETMEFAATDGRRMELLRFRNDIRFFNVHYTSFSDLKLTGLKAYANEGKKVSCRQCHSQVYVKTWPFAQSFACPACDSRYGASEGTIRKLNKRNQTDTGPGLQIGATGILNGVPYEVIGYALKSESKAAEAQWKEYTLFHPTEGYAFLSEFEGHYILARESGNAPVLNSGAATEMIYADEPYQLFNRYRYTLVNAKGEFPYNLFNDGDKDIREFISPPEMWI